MSDPITPSAVAAAAPPAAWMNCRRLRYTFWSVISELRMSAARLISISQLYEPFGVHTGEIPPDQAQVAGSSPRPAVLFPAPRRGYCLFRGHVHPSGYTQPPDEVDVLHDGHIGVTPEPAKCVPPDEQRLVAVRQGEHPHAYAHAEFDDPRGRRRRIEREAETSMADARVAVR